jgi:hypothetical protein
MLTTFSAEFRKSEHYGLRSIFQVFFQEVGELLKNGHF